jgi:hypothetical protein
MSRTGPLSPQQVEAIEQAARDYFEGWFEGDPDRLSRCLHPRLAKRNIDQPDRFDSRSMRTTGNRWWTVPGRAEAPSTAARRFTVLRLGPEISRGAAQCSSWSLGDEVLRGSPMSLHPSTRLRIDERPAYRSDTAA